LILSDSSGENPGTMPLADFIIRAKQEIADGR